MQPQRRPLLSLLLLFAALLLSSGKGVGAQQAHSVPLELLRSGHIAIQVHVNGQGPFRLILDTGSPVTFISTRMARELGLLSAQPNKSAQPQKPAVPSALAMATPIALKSIMVGDTEVKNLSALILDHPIIDALSGFVGRLDGIVGFSFFARFHTTLDYVKGRVTFEPVDYAPQDVMTSVMGHLFGGAQKARVIAPKSLWGLTVMATPQNDGVTATQIFISSAAAAAGFQPGDRITTLDDRWTDTVTDLFEAASLTVPNQPVVVKVMRGDQEVLLTVRPRPGM